MKTKPLKAKPLKERHKRLIVALRAIGRPLPVVPLPTRKEVCAEALHAIEGILMLSSQRTENPLDDEIQSLLGCLNARTLEEVYLKRLDKIDPLDDWSQLQVEDLSRALSRDLRVEASEEQKQRAFRLNPLGLKIKDMSLQQLMSMSPADRSFLERWEAGE